MRIGIDSFVSTVTDPVTGVDVSPVGRVEHLLEEVERADQVGLDTYGIGEHHRRDFMDSAPAVLLAAAAARTTNIRLNSAVAVLSNIPIAVNGLGVREQLHAWLLAPLGIPREIAVAISLLLYGHLLVGSLLGLMGWLRAPALPVDVAEQVGM